jgi:tetratricopeptide (TPR) repeat protein
MTPTTASDPHARLQSAAVAERESAVQPRRVRHRLHLVELYRALGTEAAADAELTRLLAQFPRNPRVLAPVLDQLRAKRAIRALEGLVDSARKITNTKLVAFHLAYARALALLGRLEEAASEFARVAGPRLPPEAWGPLASFVCHHPDTMPLPVSLRALATPSRAASLPAAGRYAVLRACVESDRRTARRLLDLQEPDHLSDPETLADLALQSFRLGAWDRADEAAARAVSLRGDHEAAARMRVSASSFAGRLEQAAAGMAAQPEPSPPAHLPPHALAELRRFVDYKPADLCSWAVLVREAPQEPWRLRPQPVGSWPQDPPACLSASPHAKVVSLAGPNWDLYGPPDVLEELDWGTDHLMVQRKAGAPILHAFVPVGAAWGWAWEEVPVRTDGDPAACGFRLIRADRRASDPQDDARRALWRAAQRELETARLHEEEPEP